jgi:signal transduction histidine kinase
VIYKIRNGVAEKIYHTPDLQFLAMTHLSNGRRLLVTNQGIKQLNLSGKKKFELTTPIEFSRNQSLSFYQIYETRDRRVLIPFGNREIWIMQPQGDTLALIRKETPNADIRNFTESMTGDTIYAATSKGLYLLDHHSSSFIFRESWQLGVKSILSAITDKDGKVWATTATGLWQGDESRLFRYGLQDGMQSDDFSAAACLLASDGTIWIGLGAGLLRFHPDSIAPYPFPPRVHIEELFINNIPRKGENVDELWGIKVKYSENNFRFSVVASGYHLPENNTLRYRLVNYENEWKTTENNAKLEFSKLPPRKYTLEIVGSNINGIESDVKYFRIKIIPPFWQSAWFWILVIIVLSGSFYQIYKYRIAQLLRIERLRNQISTDLHDDIGATLSNVNILTTLVRQKLPPNSDALQLLARIEEEVQSSAESLDDIIWSINPKNDPLDRVLARMRRFATEVFEAKDIKGELRFTPEAKRLRLDMAKRRQFYLFFKEAVNNLAKYSQCRNAVVAVAYENKRLSVSIEDDGIGFDMATTREGSNGLSTMRQRAQNLHGKFEIFSAPGQGTKVEISFPITEIRD